ncbi:hypothetical protein E2562_031189 [Oryza meyeriana var. granulata]|uniref:Cyclin-like domain-containing protein n=1 Tax=Oryza meyeriana var. granulata TaxID=110450 RepID=A0A6G1ERH5_9ORYZ|nr:hypothetical protein E2562_031189 [Oryza meyeriana var. granulata]
MSSWAAGRRSSVSAVAEGAGAGGAKAAAQSERRVPLRNLTNVVGGRARAARAKVDACLLPCTSPPFPPSVSDDKLHISDNRDVADMASNWRKHGSDSVEIDYIVDIDNNHEDPQLCATLAFDIYKHLRVAETKKRPSTDFVETIQKNIDTSMRAVLIDWLVEVTEEYRLVPETLYLTVNYIDRYLSGKVINRQRMQLLGVACLLIAAKYEEICPPQVEELCYITDNAYTKNEVLKMEASVLNYLKFEMTAPTAKCFLRFQFCILSS